MKQVKTQWLGMRADDALVRRADEYVAASRHVATKSELIKLAVIEYMAAHPVRNLEEARP